MAIESSPRPLRSQQASYVAAFLAYALLLNVLLTTLPWHTPEWLANPQPQPSAAATVLTTPDEYFSPMQALVEPYGYALEEHFVTTADGFILRLFRIPCSRGSTTEASSCPSSSSIPALSATCGARCSTSTCSGPASNTSSGPSSRPVVFLQHALMDSSAGWLLLGPGRSLALKLADAGFDVWMGNSRGNRFSRNHTHLGPEQEQFWAWSWQQQAEHDLPASISYVLQTTEQQRLVYVGYSQGTMTALAALSSQSQLAASVSLAILLAPVAFTTSMSSPAFVLSSRLGLDTYGLQHGWMEWGSHQPYWGQACARLPWLCLFYLTSFCGSNPQGNIDAALVPSIFQHLPAGTSVRVMSHWAQSIRRSSSTFLHKFDYGNDCSNLNSNVSQACNLHVYGQPDVPVYNMSAITTPLALFTGGRDTISSLTDVELLKQRLLPGVVQLHHHLPDYGHLDFELGSDAPDVLYPHLLRLADSFSGRSTQ